MTSPQHARKRDPITFSGVGFVGKALSFWLVPSAAVFTAVNYAERGDQAPSLSQPDRPPLDEAAPLDGW
ncbi:hypothetical protein [Streptomyces violaceusniger]|uniref:Uncharacterized protein n=1 Tax=Streptomyces violaceusniger (strain Tu 4113) TaxID=653045 RepID=G2PHV7_STRV4|nr:hypothetical protein [Streptomyces violaceusniger]AEM88908.1 hypothetical protein Strvi_0133 [Streptomyces violaceusniger Tu 4113]